MKLFRKLMAGAMAIAMLSVYTVAFATGTVSGAIVSGGEAPTIVTGAGRYVGNADAVFLMKLPTAAGANAALAFTVDPNRTIESSKPTNADPNSSFGSVLFSTVSGANNVVYKDESAPLKVISMSSVDVKVNMLATLSKTKMTLSTTSGFSAPNDTKSHLYLGVKVATISGGVVDDSSAPEAISALGAKAATNLLTVPANFKTDYTTGASLVSGAQSAADNATCAEALGEDSWRAVQYTVVGASNADADWQIEGIEAPNLTIKWVIDSSKDITYDVSDPDTNTAYVAKLDKNSYKFGETMTIYVKPTSATAKLKSVTFKYITISAKDGTMEKEAYLKADLVGTTVDGVTTATEINGVYSATLTFPNPSTMAKGPDITPAGATITTFKAPYFDIVVA